MVYEIKNENENKIQEALSTMNNYIDTEDLILIYYAVQLKDGLFNDIEFVDNDGYIFEEEDEVEKIVSYVFNEENQFKLAKWIVDNGMTTDEWLDSVTSQFHNDDQYAMYL